MQALNINFENRNLLLRMLFEHEIRALDVDFSGSGDSGELTEIRATSIDAEIEIDDGVLTQIKVPADRVVGLDQCWVNGAYGPRDFAKNPVTLCELIETACYALLEVQHGGWEINAGSHGTIHIALPRDDSSLYLDAQISIDCYEHDEYDEDDDSYTEEEYNDE